MRTLIAALIATLSATAAFADFTGDYKMRARDHEVKGKIMSNTSAQKVRMDMEHERMGRTSQIFDGKAKKGWMIMHNQRMVMTMSAGDVEKSPICSSTSDPARCLADQGFRRAGSEHVNGFDCEIYEKNKDGEVTRFYRPTVRKDAPFVRMTMDKGGNRSMQMDIENLKFDSVSASQFDVPKDYAVQDMGAFGAPKRKADGSVDAEAMKRQMMEQFQKMGAGMEGSRKAKRH